MKTKLKNIDTRAPESFSKEKTKKELASILEDLDDLQNLLYAENKHSLLIVIQGMDASGKDGLTRDVFTSMNPQGVNVISFKEPTAVELTHDFLWRVHLHAPPKGMIHIFNRSYYEDILVTRVHNLTDDATAKECGPLTTLNTCLPNTTIHKYLSSTCTYRMKSN
jgi:polyphosphate kinase 2 (PPK2 family)